MSQQHTNDPESDNQESSPEIVKVIELARQHFIAVNGREPSLDECIFDQEPPSDYWQPAVLCTSLLLNEERQ